MVNSLINSIAIRMHSEGAELKGFDMMQIATDRLLSSAPTVHPLINAAHQTLVKFQMINN